MDYKNFEKDFVTRTLETIHKTPSDYEVTLLINCLLGLVVLPDEKLYNQIFTRPLNQLPAGWGLSSANIINGNCATLKNLLHRMRHSISHFDIEVTPGMHSIIFKRQNNRPPRPNNRPPRPDVNFEVEATIDDLRMFVNQLANSLLGKSQ